MILKQGFTLLELVIVIIIIGVLASVGVAQYGKAIEKGREAEARVKLGFFRTSEIAYKLEYGSYAVNLSIFAPVTCTNSYFAYLYGISAGRCGSVGESLVTAVRCTSGGKPPDGSSAYEISLCIESGTWGYYYP